MASWGLNLESKALIGSVHGPRPPVEILRQWMVSNWASRGVRIPTVQYLPNNFYIFYFEEASHAYEILSHGTWLIRNTPLVLSKWYNGFNPRTDKPSKIPVWIELPDMPPTFSPWVKEIGARLGKVLGRKPVPAINPRWDQEILVEIDVAKPLLEKVQRKSGRNRTSSRATSVRQINRFAPLLVDVDIPLHDPVDAEDEEESASEEIDNTPRHNETQDSSSKLGPACDEDIMEVPATQLDEFTEQLNAQDEMVKADLSSVQRLEPGISGAALEDEPTPASNYIQVMKRKKEKSTDPRRLFNTYLKPSKNIKKS